MSHNYLLDTYRFIDMRLEDAHARLAASAADDPDRRFVQGRCDALNDVKTFLSAGFDHKLPRRIYRQLNRMPADTPSRGE